MTRNVLDIVLGIVIAFVICLPLFIGVPLIRHWVWLRKFRRENRIARDKFMAEVRADEARWAAETAEWLKNWERKAWPR